MQQATPNPALRRLDALVGEWEMQASIGGQSTGSARTVFQWLEGAFVIQRADAGPALPGTPPEWLANSPFPLVTIMGLDESTGEFSMLYADARGACRASQMTLSGGVWKIWREAPGFFQRFVGAFSDDGQTITGRWEGSRDGSDWQPDFDVIYTKVR